MVHTLKIRDQVGEMVQSLRTLDAFPEDQCPIPESTWWLTGIRNSSSRGLDTFFWPLQAPGTKVVPRCTCKQNIQNKIDMKKKKKGPLWLVMKEGMDDRWMDVNGWVHEFTCSLVINYPLPCLKVAKLCCWQRCTENQTWTLS